MSDPNLLLHHIQANISDFVTQMNHLKLVKGRARTGYYKICLMLLSSVIEVLLFRLIEESLLKNPLLSSSQKTTIKKTLYELPNTISHNRKLVICEIEEQDYKLTTLSNFSSMNRFSYKAKIINKSLFNKIERIIAKRNEIHLQGLSQKTRRYNQNDMVNVSEVITEIAVKVSFNQ